MPTPLTDPSAPEWLRNALGTSQAQGAPAAAPAPNDPSGLSLPPGVNAVPAQRPMTLNPVDMVSALRKGAPAPKPMSLREIAANQAATNADVRASLGRGPDNNVDLSGMREATPPGAGGGPGVDPAGLIFNNGPPPTPMESGGSPRRLEVASVKSESGPEESDETANDLENARHHANNAQFYGELGDQITGAQQAWKAQQLNPVHADFATRLRLEAEANKSAADDADRKAAAADYEYRYAPKSVDEAIKNKPLAGQIFSRIALAIGGFAQGFDHREHNNVYDMMRQGVQDEAGGKLTVANAMKADATNLNAKQRAQHVDLLEKYQLALQGATASADAQVAKWGNYPAARQRAEQAKAAFAMEWAKVNQSRDQLTGTKTTTEEKVTGGGGGPAIEKGQVWVPSINGYLPAELGNKMNEQAAGHADLQSALTDAATDRGDGILDHIMAAIPGTDRHALLLRDQERVNAAKQHAEGYTRPENEITRRANVDQYGDFTSPLGSTDTRLGTAVAQDRQDQLREAQAQGAMGGTRRYVIDRATGKPKAVQALTGQDVRGPAPITGFRKGSR